MFVIKYKKYFLSFSLILVLISLFFVFTRPVNLSIEFTGGTVLEIKYAGERPGIEDVKTAIANTGVQAQVQEFAEQNIIMRSQELNQEQIAEILNAISFDKEAPEIVRMNSIGPSLGEELKTRAYYAVGIVALVIILFIAFVFRKVSKPVSSWKYGVIAVVALLHDILIPAGIWALFGLEVNSLFVVGLLSILGISVNDTIVVFDRIRENLRENQEHTNEEPFGETVGRSITQTMVRSIFTSVTLFVVLVALFIWGPASTQGLALVLSIGIIVGTYSSIFVASPLLTLFTGRK